MTLGDALALSKSEPIDSGEMTLDQAMGIPVATEQFIPAVPEEHKVGFIKGIADNLYSGMLSGATSFNQLLGLGAFKGTRDIFVTPGAKEAVRLRKETYSENKGIQFGNDFISSLGNMGVTLPIDIMTGGATKARLAGEILPKVETILSRIPDFALGSGWRGLLQGVESPGNVAEKTVKGITGAGENIAINTAFGKAGGSWKAVPIMTSLGWGSAVYEAAKEGRLPTKDEQISGAANGTAYGVAFALLPHLKDATKLGPEKTALGKYEKLLNEHAANGDFDKVKEIVDTMIADEAIRPEVKQAIGKVLEQPLISPQPPVSGTITPEGAKGGGNWEIGQQRDFAFDPNSTKNEGRFRLLPPDEIQKDSYFRRKSSAEGVSYVMGKDQNGKDVIQAIRFDKSIMPEDKAAQWWKENKGKYQFNQVAEPTGGGKVAEVPGTGKTKVRGLALGVEEKAIENKLTQNFADLPEYQTINMKDQATKAQDLLTKDPEKARRVAMGEEVAPEGILPESIFVAVENQAVKSGDVSTLRALATASSLTTEATTMGQRIRTLAERDPESPVTAINEVVKARQESAQKRLKIKNVKQLTDKDVSDIKKEMKKTASTKEDWATFIKSLEC